MDTLALECFLTVSRCLSFTEAAKRLHKTQSAVTQQILKLESELDKKLFNRGRNVSLTNDGEILLTYAEQIEGLMRSARDHLSAPDLEGKLRIGLPEDFASIFLTEILGDFQRLHPRVLLRVECDLTLHLLNTFKQRELDLVLIKAMHPIEMPSGFEVWTEPLEWVGHKSLQEGLSSVKVWPLVLAPTPCVYRSCAIEALQQAACKWQTTFVSPSYVGKISAVEAGMGLTVLPRTLIPKNLNVINSPQLPQLPELHVSILKRVSHDRALESLESFLISRLKDQSRLSG